MPMSNPVLIETKRMRELASAVLDRLLVERVECEMRLAETGRRDPLKTVTGSSAMDNAVVTTRDIIKRMDAMLAAPLAAREECSRRLKPMAGVAPATAAR
jgi:hypothetical protein